MATNHALIEAVKNSKFQACRGIFMEYAWHFLLSMCVWMWLCKGIVYFYRSSAMLYYLAKIHALMLEIHRDTCTPTCCLSKHHLSISSSTHWRGESSKHNTVRSWLSDYPANPWFYCISHGRKPSNSQTVKELIEQGGNPNEKDEVRLRVCQRRFLD